MTKFESPLERTPVEIWHQIIDTAIYDPTLDFHLPENMQPGNRRRRAAVREGLPRLILSLWVVCRSWSSYICTKEPTGYRRVMDLKWGRERWTTRLDTVEILELVKNDSELGYLNHELHDFDSLTTLFFEHIDNPLPSTQSFHTPSVTVILNILLRIPTLRALYMPIISQEQLRDISAASPNLVALRVQILFDGALTSDTSLRKRRPLEFCLRNLEILAIMGSDPLDYGLWRLPSLRHFYQERSGMVVTEHESFIDRVGTHWGPQLRSLALPPRAKDGRSNVIINDHRIGELRLSSNLTTLFTNLDVTTSEIIPLLRTTLRRLTRIVHTESLEWKFVDETLKIWAQRAKIVGPDRWKVILGFTSRSWGEILNSGEGKVAASDKPVLLSDQMMAKSLMRKATRYRVDGLELVDVLGMTLKDTKRSQKNPFISRQHRKLPDSVV